MHYQNTEIARKDPIVVNARLRLNASLSAMVSSIHLAEPVAPLL